MSAAQTAYWDAAFERLAAIYQQLKGVLADAGLAKE
jgi:hypothetical protein